MDHEQRAAWLAARNRTDDGQWLLGGSELASVLGWDPRCDALRRWALKRGLVDPEPTSEDAMAGIYLEPSVLHWYADRYGRRCISPAYVARHIDARVSDPALDDLIAHLCNRLDVHYGPDGEGRVMFRSKTKPWALLNIDTFAWDPELGWGVVDAKCTPHSARSQWMEAVPPHYLPQLTHYIDHCGLRWGGWAVLFGGQALERFDVTDEQLAPVADAIAEAVPPFLAHLEEGTTPSAPPSAVMARVLSQMHPAATRSRTRALWSAPLHVDGQPWHPEDFDELWERTAAQRTAVDERWGQLQAVIRIVLGDATEVLLRNGTIYRADKRNVIRRIPPCND